MSSIPIASRTRAVLIAAAVLAGAVPASGQAPAASSAPCSRPAALAPASAEDLFGYDRAAPLEWRDSLESTANGLEIHRVSFVSPRGGRATGLLYVPLEARRGPGGRFAGLVMLHGAPGDARGMGIASEPIARAGAVVLAVDAPFARRDPQKPLSFTPQDSADAVQYIVDLQRAVDVLRARSDVDPSRIGAMGASYGGSLGALFVGVEHRLRAAVLVVADAGTAAHFTDATGARMPPPPQVPAEQWCRWYDSLQPLDATRFIARAAPTRLLFLWGREDWFVRPRLANALWRAAPEPKEARWYRSGHMLPGASLGDELEWLAANLGTTPPPVFRGPVAGYVGTYTGWGGFMDPLELGVVADSAGRLELRGPFAGPDDPEGRLTYLGPSPEGETFRLDDKRLTFVRSGGRVTELHIDAPIDDPKAHLVLRRVPPVEEVSR